MIVLSLFDGISCGQQALKELGIPVEKYYASEIDKYAIAITQHNFPDTIQLGDIENWREWDIDWVSIDLIQGGSPCQGFSFAGKQLNFDDPRSKLFFTFVDILNHARKHNPNVKFLLENVRMKQEYQDIISEALGVKPVMINSALVSAQNRVRLYWTNIGKIEQPKDRGILLKDILETDHGESESTMRVPEATKKGYAEAKAGEGLDWAHPNSKTRRGRLMKYKSNCLTAGNHEMGIVQRCIQVGEADLKGHDSIKRVYSSDGKSPTLTTMGGGHREPKVAISKKAVKNYVPKNPITDFVDPYNKKCIKGDKSTTLRTNSSNGNMWVREKSKTVRSSGRGSYDKHEWDSVGNKGTELYWRKLTPLECKRLQTLPDNFTEKGYIGVGNRAILDWKYKEVKKYTIDEDTGEVSTYTTTKKLPVWGKSIDGTTLIADGNRYKALGNGWTVEVIKHILKEL